MVHKMKWAPPPPSCTGSCALTSTMGTHFCPLMCSSATKRCRTGHTETFDEPQLGHSRGLLLRHQPAAGWPQGLSGTASTSGLAPKVLPEAVV